MVEDMVLFLRPLVARGMSVVLFGGLQNLHTKKLRT